MTVTQIRAALKAQGFLVQTRRVGSGWTAVASRTTPTILVRSSERHASQLAALTDLFEAITAEAPPVAS